MFYFLSLFSLKVILEECILKFTKGICCTRLSAGNLYSSTLIELNFAIIVEYISFLHIKKFTFPDVSTPSSSSFTLQHDIFVKMEVFGVGEGN